MPTAGTPVTASTPPAPASHFWGLPATAVGWTAFVVSMLNLLVSNSLLIGPLFGYPNVSLGGLSVFLAPLALVLVLIALLVKHERSILVWLSLGAPIGLAVFAAGEAFLGG